MQSLCLEEDVFFDTFDYFPIESSQFSMSIDDELDVKHSRIDSEFWKKDVMSVCVRRNKFFTKVGLEDFAILGVNRSRDVEECDNSIDTLKLNTASGYGDMEKINFDSCTKDLDSERKLTIQNYTQNVPSTTLEKDLDKQFSFEEPESSVGLSCSNHNPMQSRASVKSTKYGEGCNGRGRKQKWWKKFLPLVGSCKKDVYIKDSKVPMTSKSKVLRNNKSCLEFTALYMGQEIQAHKGAIRTMKFNSSGCYLASGGKDCIVRIWQIKKVESPCRCEIVDKKILLGRKGVDSAQIVIPRKVFKIHEPPLLELCGHAGDVLDLSWSNDNHLLSSSMDRTVRLWKVGFDGCLKVFQHYDYVTCVQFNPINDKRFITGSIDGKIRVWDVAEKHVVNWADIKDIVTAVCYCPDGEGFVVGTFMGICRFYSYSDDVVKLDAQFQVQGKKKYGGKPITKLQFAPEDSQRVLITSADSRVRIFDGDGVIHKFRGLRKTKQQSCSSFTPDGRYIISVGDDSKIYIFNSDLTTPLSKKNHLSKDSKPLKSIRSYEFFTSKNASIAVPWPGGLDHKRSALNAYNKLQIRSQPVKLLEPSTWLWDSDFCSLGAWLFSDSVCKGGSATWPEEKLVEHSSDCTHCHYPRLTHLSATWNMVIVTASSDGVIRPFHNYGLPVRL